MRKQWRTRITSDRKRLLLVCAGVAAAAILIGAGLYMAGRRLESGRTDATRGDLAGRFEEPRVVAYNGKQYRYRNDLVTVLFMGVDKTADQSPSAQNFRNGGQADFLLLLVIDPKKETISQIQIDRDTMAEITVLGVLGNPAGTRNAQICLSHGFGDGGEQSCLFTVDAVSKHLYGIDIDFFLAMNLDGIPALNDMLGGVTVTLEDDFTSLDPTMRKGETLTLRGEQTAYYVRHRMNIGEQTNQSRMVRQRDYLGKLGVLMNKEIQENAQFIGTVFDGLKGNLITNMARGRMINEAYASRDYTRTEIISPRGEHINGWDGFVEFHADAGALEELVLEVFYEPADAPI